MNNGRMTFRFDVEKDKPEVVEHWTGSGVVTAKEKAREKLRQEESPLEHTWSYDAELQDVTPDLWKASSVAPLPLWQAAEGGSEGAQSDLDRGPEHYQDLSFAEDGYGSGSYHARRPSNWWKLALSITGAVGIGLLLGYAALSFFGGGNAGGADGAAIVDTAVVQGLNAGSAADPAGAGISGSPSAGANRIPVQVAAQSYYLLQYGVFSSSSGAAQAKQELLAAGLAAGLDPEGGNRVYAGLSSDREQAKLLSSGLKNQGIELYVREVMLPASGQLSFAGDANTVNGYFAVSGRLLGELSRLSASLLSSSGKGDITGDINAVSDLHLQWTEAAKALEKGVSPEAQGLCAVLEKSVNQGISALHEYNKNKSNGLLWEVQGSMMDFLTGQKRLLAALG